MKKLLVLSLLAPVAGCSLLAQSTVVIPPPPPTGTVVTRQLFTPDQLDLLLGSIALYPDPLLALILPASTSSSDVVLAARYFQSGGDPAQVDAQPWDDAVRALAHYPQIIAWMDQNLAWTIQLGGAFSVQPNDVMNAVQRLRARAQAAGTLLNTPQQQVVYQSDTILIVPANPDVIYVPYYDPGVVYAPARGYYSYSSGAVYGFSSGFAAGWWLCYGLDWGHHRVWSINHEERERYWREHRRDWHRPEAYLPYDGPRPDRRTWQPHGESRPPQHVGPVRPPQAVAPSLRYEDRRDEARRPGQLREQGNPSRPQYPSNFVGPTAPASHTPPATASRPVTPAPSSNGPQWNRADRAWDHNPSRTPTPTVSTPMTVGPTVPSGRTYVAPSRPAQELRVAPAIPRYTPPAPSPTPAPSLPHYTPPAPQAAPQPAQQQANPGNDDERRRPVLIRPH